jgi:hypothetical protein
VNTVREDPQRRGLLFAGTERAVYVSFDDGANWGSLRLNLPATSVRDLIVKDDDLAIATHGRGFWILDNITPLRQLFSPHDGPGIASNSKPLLFKPQTALRVRWNFNTDTPLPPDEPVGENPPEGAMIDYSLGGDVSGPVSLEIKDAQGVVVRRYASTDPLPTPDPKLKIPRYWVRTPEVLSDKPGLHRFFWDMHGQPLTGADPEYPMTAVLHKTAPQPTAPLVVPGNYSVVLTAGGTSLEQPLPVKMDPRVKATTADLAKQFEISQRLFALREQLQPIGKSYEKLAAELAKAKTNAGGNPIQEQIAALRRKLEGFASPADVRSGNPLQLDVLSRVKRLFGDLQDVDAAPTPAQQTAAIELERNVTAVVEHWQSVAPEAATLNAQLASAGLESIKSK